MNAFQSEKLIASALKCAPETWLRNINARCKKVVAQHASSKTTAVPVTKLLERLSSEILQQRNN